MDKGSIERGTVGIQIVSELPMTRSENSYTLEVYELIDGRLQGMIVAFRIDHGIYMNRRIKQFAVLRVCICKLLFRVGLRNSVL